MLNKLCMPALIYLIYMVAHISIDAYYGLYNMAFIKIWIGIIVTLLLNILCENNMSIISWIIIFIPFILMTIIAVFVLYTLGLDPSTGKAKTTDTTTDKTAAPTDNVPPIYTTTDTAPLYITSTIPAQLTIYSNTPFPASTSSSVSTPPTTSSPDDTTSAVTTTSVPSTAYSDIPPPSIYANPVAVNYHGVLGDNIRAIQSNYS